MILILSNKITYIELYKPLSHLTWLWYNPFLLEMSLPFLIV